jgi:RNA polymerase sigma factor (sigma-70 family)
VAAGAPELAAGVRSSGVSEREQLLEELRPVSFAIAYRMLGSVSEAEDIVQEALLRVHQALEAGDQIASPRAFVATVTTRLAINELRSARARRERYVGEWLPAPIITDGRDDPARHAETADSLSLAMLVLLESLSPEQRAVLLLHDVFDYGYPQIATIVGKSEDNVRQLATRARRHVEQRRPRFQTTREQRDELAERFFAAAEQGDLAGLEALLAHDVQLTGDGGGKAHVDQLVPPGDPHPGRVAAPRRDQRRSRSARLRPTAATDRRGGARHRWRSDHRHQLDRQPRQADPPRDTRRPRIAPDVSEVNSGTPSRVACSPGRRTVRPVAHNTLSAGLCTRQPH